MGVCLVVSFQYQPPRFGNQVFLSALLALSRGRVSKRRHVDWRRAKFSSVCSRYLLGLRPAKAAELRLGVSKLTNQSENFMFWALCVCVFFPFRGGVDSQKSPCIHVDVL